jgi:hypothetical protein
MRFVIGGTAKGYLAGALAAVVLAGCAKQAPVAVVVPTPPAPVMIPPRPYPPVGAPPNMVIPAVGADGVRMTVNTRLSPTQALWNYRSAYNVAALNCVQPEHADILVGYRAFLKKHARVLSSANRALDAEFRAKHGARFIAPRETYMTQVYNYFANPVTLGAFCDATLATSRSAQLVESADLEAFSAAELVKIEQVFEAFFRAYEQYRIDAANWDAQYARLYAPRPVTADPAAVAPVPAITAYSPSSVPQ